MVVVVVVLIGESRPSLNADGLPLVEKEMLKI